MESSNPCRGVGGLKTTGVENAALRASLTPIPVVNGGSGSCAIVVDW